MWQPQRLVSGIEDGSIVTEAGRIPNDNDFLSRVEPFAEPRGRGLEDGVSGYAEGLRRGRDGSRRVKPVAYVVGARVMGTAIVAAAAVVVFVFAV